MEESEGIEELIEEARRAVPIALMLYRPGADREHFMVENKILLASSNGCRVYKASVLGDAYVICEKELAPEPMSRMLREAAERGYQIYYDGNRLLVIP